MVPTLGASKTPVETIAPPPDAAAVSAGERMLRRLSDATPAMRRPPRSHVPMPAGRQLPATAVSHLGAPRAAAAQPSPDPRPTVTHIVRGGDTLWDLSRRYGVTVEALAEANDLKMAAVLQPGQRLTVPGAGPSTRAMAHTLARRESTVVHVVRSGETLWDIARRYGTQVEDLMALNHLGHSDWIKPGQRLQVSGRTLPRHRQVIAQTRSGSAATLADARLLRASGGFLWPARGTLTSRFGWRRWRQHEGIDIAAPAGTPIYAARDGVVDVAGWHYGYGKAVLLRHEGDVVTVYGHASVLLVHAGQRVKKGQVIARVGCTGWCTGSHLHFEVRRAGRAVDPMPYLR